MKLVTKVKIHWVEEPEVPKEDIQEAKESLSGDLYEKVIEELKQEFIKELGLSAKEVKKYNIDISSELVE